MPDAQGKEIVVGQRPALPPEAQALVDERRARNLMVSQIRGQLWGKDLNNDTIRAVAEYCRRNRLDAVRHVEILGGRLYLTAELYQELGAPLIARGEVIPLALDMITNDPRLAEIAAGDGPMAAWAREEADRRTKERIRLGAPDEATAVAVTKLQIAVSGAIMEGCNWCGGGTRKKRITDKRTGQKIDIPADPIGDLEPTKTAITRSARRAWKQIAVVNAEYAQRISPLEAAAAEIEIVQEAIEGHRDVPLLGAGPTARDELGRPVPVTTVVHTKPREPEPVRDRKSVV